MAAEISTSPSDPVKQFSVFAENRLGRLYELISLLKQHEVHVLGMTVLDTTDSAIVRFIVDDPDRTRELMINNDFPYVECAVLVVEFTETTQLQRVLAALYEAEINIHYLYSLIPQSERRCALAISAEDEDVAAQSLCHRGFRVLSQAEISR
jgi:hypothetical protein